MNESAAFGAAIAGIGALIWLLVRARGRRPVDPYKEALQEYQPDEEQYQPTEPSKDPHDGFDRIVNAAQGCFKVFNAFFSAFLVALVAYFAVVDAVTRVVVIATLVLFGIILVIWRVRTRWLRP